jgi:SNF2 family DNA or RNA helicase
LLLAETEDAPALPADLSHRLQESFARGHGYGRLQLGAAEVETVLPPVLGYWRELGGRYVTAVCTRPDLVTELAAELAAANGIKRKGVVLAFLMRFKQICNHPSQWLGDGAWTEADSGKLARLREIADVIAAKQEEVLVFTQFREVTSPLAAFLGSVFGRPGLVLHGETDVKKRQSLVQRFQEDEGVPFFVLSLKAGGSGLNLTAHPSGRSDAPFP